MAKLSKKLSFRLSSLKRVIDHDLIVLKENRVIAEAIFLLEDKLIELNSNLPHLAELLNLRDEFLKESDKALNESKTMVNIIIYLQSKFDHHNKCGSAFNVSRVPRNFDSLLQLMFDDDHNACKDEVKTNLIQLTKEIELFELTTAFGKAKLLQPSSVALSSLHQTESLEFQKLTDDLDRLVVKFQETKEQSSKFVEVIQTNLDRFKADLKAVLSELSHFLKFLMLKDELGVLDEKEKAKQKELKKRLEQSTDAADLEQELASLKDEIAKKQESIDEQTKKFDEFLNNKLDQNALSYVEQSERHRQITESVIIEKQLSKKIKVTLVKMGKLIDVNFKLKYADLNEQKFFSNEISDFLFFEIYNALEVFARERTLIKTKTPKETS